MTGIDTNVLLRFLVKDDEEQTEIATRFMSSLTRENRGFVSIVTLAESVWVLRRSYKQSNEAIIKVLKLLLDAPALQIHKGEVLRDMLNSNSASSLRTCDLGDLIIAALGRDAECSVTVTFDKESASKIKEMQLLK